jgi:protein TonB
MKALSLTDCPDLARWRTIGGKAPALPDIFRPPPWNAPARLPDEAALHVASPDARDLERKVVLLEASTVVPENLPAHAPPSAGGLRAGLLSSLGFHAVILGLCLLLGAEAAVLETGGQGPLVFQVGFGGLAGSGASGGGREPPGGQPEKSAPPEGDTRAAVPERASLPPESTPPPQAREAVPIPIKAPVRPRPKNKSTPPPKKTPEQRPHKGKNPAEHGASAKHPSEGTLAPELPSAARSDALLTAGSGAAGAGAGSGLGKDSGPGGGKGQGSGTATGGGDSGDGYAKGNYLYIRKRILRHLHYPLQAQRLGLQGTATIAFVIDRQGRAQTIQVAVSSGYESIDQAAMEAVQDASPFPPPPEAARISIPIVLKLR